MIDFSKARWITATGEAYELIADGRWFTDLVGLGLPQQDIATTQAAGQHGVSYECLTFKQREINATLTWNACDNAQRADLRRELIYAFTPAQYQGHVGECCVGCGCEETDNKSYIEFEYCALERDDCDDAIESIRNLPKCGCKDVFCAETCEPDPNVPYRNEECFTYAEKNPNGIVGFCPNCDNLRVHCGNPACKGDCSCVRVKGRRILYGAACCGSACKCTHKRHKYRVKRRVEARLIDGLAFEQDDCKIVNFHDIEERLTFGASPFLEDAHETVQRVYVQANGDFVKEVPLLYVGDWATPVTITAKGAFDFLTFEHYGTCEVFTLDYCAQQGETVTINTATKEIYSDLVGEIPSAAIVTGEACSGAFELVPPRPRHKCQEANCIRIEGSGATITTEVDFSFRNKWLSL